MGLPVGNLEERARNLSGLTLHVPKQMAGAIWDGLVHGSMEGEARQAARRGKIGVKRATLTIFR